MFKIFALAKTHCNNNNIKNNINNKNNKGLLFAEHSCTLAEAHFGTFALGLFCRKVLGPHSLVGHTLVVRPGHWKLKLKDLKHIIITILTSMMMIAMTYIY